MTPATPARSVGPLTATSPTTLVLIAANAVPLASIFVFGWDVTELLLLYWGESVVIGAYTLVKLGVVMRRAALLVGPFFVVHFGFIMLWCLGVTLMVSHELRKIATGSYQRPELGAIALDLAPALAVFLVSHGVSFFSNFLGRREYVGRDGRDVMLEPYKRVGPMLGMVLLAAFVVCAFGGVGLLLPMLVAVKTAFDVLGHLNERGHALARAGSGRHTRLERAA